MESPEETEQKLWVPHTGHITGWAITDFSILKSERLAVKEMLRPRVAAAQEKKQRAKL